VREGQPGHDSKRARKLGAPLHDPGSVAHSDKYLATTDKFSDGPHTYKTRHLDREPKRVPLQLTTESRAKTNSKIGMEKDRKTIAIIDDDNSIRQALRRVLNTAGFQVQLYCSAEDFLAAIDTSAAGCAVVDLELGTMSGFELARHPAVVAKKLPIIFISGTADETARASANALGCVEYLRKPFMPVELIGAIFRAMRETPQTS